MKNFGKSLKSRGVVLTVTVALFFFFVLPRCADAGVWFADTMEGTPQWTADVGTGWAITSEDGAFHSGAKAWTDSPGTYYANSADSSLTMTTAVDLSAATTPKLVFWHTCQLETEFDFGYVEISVDGGTTWSAAKLATFTGISPWKREQIDLTGFAGQASVKIRFRIHTDKTITWDGWCIDDVSIAEPPSPVVDFTVGNPQTTTLDLAWSPSLDPDFANYKIYRSTTADVSTGSALVATLTDKAAASFKDQNLVPDTTYYYKVYVFTANDLAAGTTAQSGKTAIARFAYPFFDDLENSVGGWLAASPWGLTSTDKHSGTHCWTDSPDGAYAAGSDKTLQLSVDLGSAQMPVLSFWQRYNFDANSDFGFVEVREEGAATWARLYFATGTISSWTEEKIDLSNYAGKKIDLRFRVVTDANGIQADGWYIDDVRIAETTTSTPLSYPLIDAMETGGNWHSGSWTLVPDGRNGGWACTDSSEGIYGPETDSELILSTTIDKLGNSGSHPQLSFWHKYEIFDTDYIYCSGGTYEHDRGRVYLSTNKGQPGTWKELAAYYGTQSTWKKEQIDLSAWAGLPDIRLKFVMSDRKAANNNCNTRQAGWTIDDVVVENMPVDVALSITSSAMNAVVLSWTQNDDADFDHYEIHRSASPGVTRESALVASINDQGTTAYADAVAMVQPGVYYYRIWVVDKDGNASPGSSELEATCSVPLNAYPFFDNAESGTAKWSHGSTWFITSAVAHDDANAWASSSGNYPANANTTLSTFVNLAGSATPVLTFWHKYSLEEAKDFVRLEVSTDNGQTWTALRTFTGTETSWNQERVNLTPYTGNAQLGIRFRLTSDAANQQEGWYMDGLEIKEGFIKADYPFNDTVENGISPWFFDSPWSVVALPASETRNNTATIVWSDSPGSYASGADSSLYLTIDLGTAQMPLLSFWHRYNLDANSDFAYIEARETGAASWKRLYFITGTSQWAESRIDLSDYAGKQIDVRFHLTADANGVQSDGWMIDDVRIAETTTPPLAYPFFDGLETGDNWSNASWSLVADSKSGSLAFADSAAGNYGAETKADLIMANTIDLGNSAHPQLSFWHKHEIFDTDYIYCGGGTYEHDRGRVLLSTKKGQPGTWKEIAAYFGAQSTWKREQIDLTPWAGLADVRIKFVMDDVRAGNGNCNTRQAGWTIDDIAIENAPADVALAVSASSMNTVSLAWSKNADADFARYEIYRSSAPGVVRTGTPIVSISVADTKTYNDIVAMVQPGSYYYRMWVFDEDGNVSMGSNEVQATYAVPVNGFPFAENGESGTGKWAWGTPWSITDTVKREGNSAWSASTGNYPPDANTSLSTFINLTGSTTPVLTFWHKYSLEAGKDFLRLEVSVDNGQTWTTLKTYTGAETAWNQERVNLTPYTGNAQLGLRFRLSSDSVNQQEGWYMDDLQIREEAVKSAYPFNDSMENGPTPWFYDSPWSIVQLPAELSRNNAASNVWTDSPDASYAAGIDASLYLAIDLGAARIPTLSFWQRYAFDANSDHGYVEVREAGSTAWKRLYFITGTSSSWVEARIDLANYAGKQIDVRFRTTADANGVQSDGWYIDDVKIEETNTPPLPYPFTESFEDTAFANRWIISSWTPIAGANTGTYGITDSISGNYGTEVSSDLILGNNISFTGTVRPQLTFWHKYEIYNNNSFYCGGTTSEHDYGLVYLSTNSGQPGTWKQIAAFNGSQTTWKKETVDLGAWAGLPNVRIKFVMNDNKSANGNCNTQMAGWTIDDVRIGEDEAIPSYIVKLSGDSQNGQTGAPLNDNFVVKVTDAQSRPKAGIEVVFEATTGGGSLSTLAGTTDALGLISTKLTLGSASGVNTATATIPGTDPLQSATFTATGYAVNQAMTLTKASGDNQVFVKELALPNPMVVKVADIQGNPVSGVDVSFSVIAGGGTLSPATPAPTDENGLASAALTLGASTGVTIVSAASAGLIGSPTLFTAASVLQGGTLGDTDGDGIPDDWESARSLDPLDPADAALDADADSLSNFVEFSRGTNPNHADSDSDGMADAWEIQYGLNPLDPSDSIKDANNNGITNLQEYLNNTAPVYQRHFTVAATTTDSMAFYGTAAIDGAFAQPGDEIAAVCPDDIVCGQFTVETIGQYGFMNVYGDDPETPVKDGAAAGDNIAFKVWDAKTGVELAAVAQVVSGTNPPSWTADGAIANVNLNAAGKQIIPLKAGWNLFSFSVKNCYYTGEAVPFAPMLDGINYIKVDSIANVLSSIAGKYDVVRGFDVDGAHTWDPSLDGAGFNTLHYLAAGYGYWIKMNEEGNLELAGLKARPLDALELHTGWNLVGYWGNDVRYVNTVPSVAFPPDVSTHTKIDSMKDAFHLPVGNYSAIRSYDGISHIYVPTLIDSLNTLQYAGPGYGFWIKMKTPDDLSY